MQLTFSGKKFHTVFQDSNQFPENSISADGGPHLRVCARLTLRSEPIDTSGIVSAHLSEGGSFL